MKVQNPLTTPSFQRKMPTKLGFRDISIFLKNSDGQKETKNWQTVKLFEYARQVDERLSTGSQLSLQLKN